MLLKYHDEAGEFFEKPAAEIVATIAPTVTERPGTPIGPYKLLQQIGEGRMGVVYMAEQKEPVERRVALKIIKPGMDTRQVIGFANRQQYSVSGRRLAVADLNADGRPDVITTGGGFDGVVRVLLGNEDGTLRYAGEFATGGVPESVVVGEFTGDGVPDLATVGDHALL
jgi:hypothetical protein